MADPETLAAAGSALLAAVLVPGRCRWLSCSSRSSGGAERTVRVPKNLRPADLAPEGVEVACVLCSAQTLDKALALSGSYEREAGCDAVVLVVEAAGNDDAYVALYTPEPAPNR